MKIRVELDATALKRLVRDYINSVVRDGNEEITLGDISIETKSAQNYKSEWETADFRAVFERTIT